jgi:hypothetical protein
MKLPEVESQVDYVLQGPNREARLPDLYAWWRRHEEYEEER